MKILAAAFLVLGSSVALMAQESLTREIGDFNKLVVSPHINLVLEAGDTPGVRIEYSNVDPHEINVDFSRETLRIYLEHAKIVEKNERVDEHYSRGVYADAEVTAYVTFNTLEVLEVRGDQYVKVLSPLTSEQLRLKIYGENVIDISEVNADFLKVSMFGENELTIRGGQVEFQKYVLYGENSVEVAQLESQHSNTNIYGESEISLNAIHEIEISAMGEPIITYSGTPVISKGIILGEPKIFSRGN